MHVVRTGPGSYIRANPNTMEDDNLDILSISSYKLFAAIDDLSAVAHLPGFRQYWKYYSAYLRTRQKKGEKLIRIGGRPLATHHDVVVTLRPHRQLILDAANHFSIDPNTLGAVIIDEWVRAHIWEEIFDKLLPTLVGWNASAGIAQVKLETARGLIRDGYYNPNPKDKKLAEENIGRVPRSYLYEYVVQPKHSVYFSAARIREIIDQWLLVIDLSDRPEIIGTLYSQKKRTPNKTPRPTDRGVQIKNEFYPLATKILRKR